MHLLELIQLLTCRVRLASNYHVCVCVRKRERERDISEKSRYEVPQQPLTVTNNNEPTGRRDILANYSIRMLTCRRLQRVIGKQLPVCERAKQVDDKARVKNHDTSYTSIPSNSQTRMNRREERHTFSLLTRMLTCRMLR